MFNGKVKSVAFQGEQLTVKLPNATDWQTFKAGSSFEVAANAKFQLQVGQDTAYLCTYG